MPKTNNHVVTDTMSVDEIKKQIAALEADQKQAMKDLRKAQREAANEAKATLARAQGFADQKVGRRLREAGATDADIDRIIKQLEERRAAETRAAKPAEKPAAAEQQTAPEKPAEKPAAAEPKPVPATHAQKPAEASKPTPRPSAFGSFSH